MKDGGSAFPYSPTYKYPGSNGDSAWTDELTDGGTTGMTLRDYFAGQALVGNLARDTAVQGQSWYWESDMVTNLAVSCYEMADAMLEAREK